MTPSGAIHCATCVKSVRIPRSGIAGSANGAVVGLTAADLESSAS